MNGPPLTTVTQTKNVDSVENSLAVPQKVKHGITIGPSNSTPRYIPQRLKTDVQINTCTRMFTAALFTITKR